MNSDARELLLSTGFAVGKRENEKSACATSFYSALGSAEERSRMDRRAVPLHDESPADRSHADQIGNEPVPPLWMWSPPGGQRRHQRSDLNGARAQSVAPSATRTRP